MKKALWIFLILMCVMMFGFSITLSVGFLPAFIGFPVALTSATACIFCAAFCAIKLFNIN